MIDQDFARNQQLLATAVKRILEASNTKPSEVKGLSSNIVRMIMKGKGNPTLYSLTCIERACKLPLIDFMDVDPGSTSDMSKPVADTLRVLETVLCVFEHVMSQGEITAEDKTNIEDLLVKARIMLLSNNVMSIVDNIPTPSEISNEQPPLGNTLVNDNIVRDQQDEGTVYIQPS